MAVKRRKNEMFYRVGHKFITSQVDRLESKKYRMIDYLKMKVEEQDWHGVADAAMDIRDIESELIPYRSFK